MSSVAAPRLDHESVHLWYAFSDEAGAPAACRHLLSVEELRRHDRLLLPEARHQFLLAHALARTVLSTYAEVRPQEWRFKQNRYGKPEISTPPGLPPLRFNLSHTSGLCACAVTLDRDVGVDVEMTGRRTTPLRIARRFFSAAEAADLERLPEESRRGRFFDYWTLKEAFIKARGRGLSLPLREFSFRMGDGEEPRIFFGPKLRDDPSHWRFFQFSPGPRHRCSVAVHNPDGKTLALTVRNSALA